MRVIEIAIRDHQPVGRKSEEGSEAEDGRKRCLFVGQRRKDRQQKDKGRRKDYQSVPVEMTDPWKYFI